MNWLDEIAEDLEPLCDISDVNDLLGLSIQGSYDFFARHPELVIEVGETRKRIIRDRFLDWLKSEANKEDSGGE
ncbi:MAG: hypothetical protein ABEJ65_03865 [bacterium]